MTLPDAEMLDYLFVYGTLRPAFPHHLAQYLAAQAQYLGPARAPGRLYDLGPYPGLVSPSGPDDWVQGDLYRLSQSADLLEVLDRYEGCPTGQETDSLFCRQPWEVVRPQGERLRAWVYVYVGPLEQARRIPSGDYLRP